jgi:succinoglycan biosynthesis protein ExoW
MNQTHAAPVSCKTAVVIPYYQEEPGILRGAVMSAIAQASVTNLEIIVVDDGSPAPGRDDLNDLDLPGHVTLKFIEQPNRGPGAARNRALDSVSSDTVYIALLDSDDRWTRDHLFNAQRILQCGYDIYFANRAYSESDDDTFFLRTGLKTSDHPCIDAQNQYFRYLGDARKQAINSVNPFPTSCVVYRRSKMQNLRFHEVSFMGEDLSFWIELTERTDRITFRPNVESIAGRGIHIFESSGWSTPGAIWRIYHYMKWRKWLQSNVLRTASENKANHKAIRELRRAFIATLLHEIRRMRAFNNPDVARFLACDPKTVFYVAPVAVGIIAAKIGRWCSVPKERRSTGKAWH